MTIIDVPFSAFDLNVSEFCRTFGPHGMSVEDSHEKLEHLVFRAGEYGFSLKTDPEFVEISDDDTLPLVRGIRFLKFGPEGSTSADEEEDMSLAIDDPVRKMTTIRVLLKEWKILLSEREKQEKEKDPFEEFWGRKRYEGEPPRGYRIPVFAPTDKDDGTVVLNGKIFPGGNGSRIIFNGYGLSLSLNSEEENNLRGLTGPMESRYGSHLQTDLDYLKTLTREEFFQRCDLPIYATGKIYVVEKFFGKKLPARLLKTFGESLREYWVFEKLHPFKGIPCLFAEKREFFEEKNAILLLAERPEDFDKFCGRLVLSPLPGISFDASGTTDKEINEKECR